MKREVTLEEAMELRGIYVPKTLNNLKTYIEETFDWEPLTEAGCWHGNIRPSDIDGCVERHMFFTALEKKGKGVPLTTGQRLTFEALCKAGWVIVVVRGDYEEWEWWQYKDEDINIGRGIGIETLILNLIEREKYTETHLRQYKWEDVPIILDSRQ